MFQKTPIIFWTFIVVSNVCFTFEAAIMASAVKDIFGPWVGKVGARQVDNHHIYCILANTPPITNYIYGK